MLWSVALLGAVGAGVAALNADAIFVLTSCKGREVCIEASTDNKTTLVADCNGEPSQMWEMPDPKNEQRWKNVLTGKCLTGAPCSFCVVLFYTDE